MKHYASTGIGRSLRQVVHALQNGDKSLARHVAVRSQRLRRDEARISRALGREVNGLEVLIVGPGPYLVEPRFFGRRNAVTAMDLDVMPRGFAPGAYLRMLRLNGFGRFAKTLGRIVLGIDRKQARAWQHELQVDRLAEPRLMQGDILKGPPMENAFDLVGCWSVFQSIPDPALAIRNMKAALRPGGVFYFGVHLYTSNTGHHDIRVFTGGAGALSAWPHLREATKNDVESSAWLNRWRLRDWRAMLDQEAPGYEEYREIYDDADKERLSNRELRAELAGFEDEELLTVDVFFLWRKPA